MSYSSWSVVFGETPSAAKWNILGTNDSSFNDGTGIGNGAILPNHLASGAGTTWAWQSYTPTWTNLTLGGAVQTAAYIQSGKIVIVRIKIKLSSSTMGTSPTFTLPVTPGSGYSTQNQFIGRAFYLCAGLNFAGDIVITSSNVAQPLYMVQATTQLAGITATAPSTWATNDYIAGTLVYEAA